MLTFTAPHGSGHVTHTQPADAYLQMLSQGLREAHGWSDDRIDDYFAEVITARR
jgi:hypothetical protein